MHLSDRTECAKPCILSHSHKRGIRVDLSIWKGTMNALLNDESQLALGENEKVYDTIIYNPFAYYTESVRALCVSLTPNIVVFVVLYCIHYGLVDVYLCCAKVSNAVKRVYSKGILGRLLAWMAATQGRSIVCFYLLIISKEMHSLIDE